jgi:hypothetical protein
MTDAHFVILIGTVWIAPHANGVYSKIAGGCLVLLGMALQIWGPK